MATRSAPKVTSTAVYVPSIVTKAMKGQAALQPNVYKMVLGLGRRHASVSWQSSILSERYNCLNTILVSRSYETVFTSISD